MKIEKEDLNCVSLDREIQMLDELRKLPGQNFNLIRDTKNHLGWK